ncbi:hypothetical protein CCHR01_04988 [Colletotrichum chrysophilum]|uniref:Uncharacterized protein n=1 Tax=Colletotrichum chrysophilum TaxID=1836956 RepID=A0AAD9APS4_9PEZI|nr:hypothetical protein CCHR01_04988 [Colletotrichum chrysophilum]
MCRASGGAKSVVLNGRADSEAHCGLGHRPIPTCRVAGPPPKHPSIQALPIRLASPGAGATPHGLALHRGGGSRFGSQLNINPITYQPSKVPFCQTDLPPGQTPTQTACPTPRPSPSPNPQALLRACVDRLGALCCRCCRPPQTSTTLLWAILTFHLTHTFHAVSHTHRTFGLRLPPAPGNAF